MKRSYKKILLPFLFMLVMLLAVHPGVSAQQAPPSPPAGGSSGGHNLEDNQGNGGAPIGNGTLFFFILSAGYSVSVAYANQKKSTVNS